MKISRLIPDAIRWYGSGSEPSGVHYECRRCGTTLSHDHANCPDCGSGDVAAIPL